MIMILPDLSTVIISVNISEVISENCTMYYPFRSGNGTFFCDSGIDTFK